MADGQGHFGHAHIAPAGIYFGVFGALIVGTILTVVAAKVDMGVLNNVVMLLIACTKATLVILYFMHVRHGTRLTTLVAVSGFAWLAILLLFTASDYVSRDWLG